MKNDPDNVLMTKESTLAILPASISLVTARCGATILLTILLSSSCQVLAQVTIKNPDHLELPEQQVLVLFRSTCQVVAQEFHVRREDVDFPLVLVLGDRKERYVSDEEHELYSVYLYQWNEPQFALSTMRLAIEHMVTRTRRDRMVMEILKRSGRIGVVSAKSLQGHR